MDQHTHYQENDGQDRDAGPFGASYSRDGQVRKEASLRQEGKIGLGHNADGFAIRREQKGETSESSQGTQGGDGGIDAQFGDDQAVQHTRQHACDDAGQDGDEGVARGQDVHRSHSADSDQDRGSHDGSNGSHRAHGNIQAAGDDDDGLAHGEQADDHDSLRQTVHQVLPGEEFISAGHSEPAAGHGDEENQNNQGKN